MNHSRTTVLLTVVVLLGTVSTAISEVTVNSSLIGQQTTLQFKDQRKLSNVKVLEIVRNANGKPLALKIERRGATEYVLLNQLSSVGDASRSPSKASRTITRTSRKEANGLGSGRRFTDLLPQEAFFAIVNYSDAKVRFAVTSVKTVERKTIGFPEPFVELHPGDGGFVRYRGEALRPRQLNYVLVTDQGTRRFSLDGNGSQMVVTIKNNHLPKRSPKPQPKPRRKPVVKEPPIHVYNMTQMQRERSLVMDVLYEESSKPSPRASQVIRRNNAILCIIGAFAADAFSNSIEPESGWDFVLVLGGKWTRNRLVEKAIKEAFPEIGSVERRAITRFITLAWDNELNPENYAKETVRDKIVAGLKQEHPGAAGKIELVDFLVSVAEAKSK